MVGISKRQGLAVAEFVRTEETASGGQFFDVITPPSKWKTGLKPAETGRRSGSGRTAEAAVFEAGHPAIENYPQSFSTSDHKERLKFR
jgi:hypothetical protein